jgi:hypothetical protein
MRALLFAVALFVPATALAQAAAPVPAGKLPDTVKPIAYRLDLTVVPEQERFSGHTEIDIQLKTASSRDLYARPRPARDACGGADRRPETPVTFTQKSPTGLAQLDFGKTVAPGKMTLKFDYDAAFADGPAGLYRIKVENDWYSWSQFESIDARAGVPVVRRARLQDAIHGLDHHQTGLYGGEQRARDRHGHTPRRAGQAPLRADPAAADLSRRFVTGPFVSVESVVPPTPQRRKPLPLR